MKVNLPVEFSMENRNLNYKSHTYKINPFMTEAIII